MRHFLGLEDLPRDELTRLLDSAAEFVGVGRESAKRPDLAGKVVANLFYEPSPRPRLSFPLAARRVGGETIDFSPNARSYVQANVNVTFNTIQTAYPVAGGLGNEVLRNADNNYVNGSLVTGWIVDKNTDASLQYTFYRADNYKAPTNAALFYGAGAKEFTVTAGVKHRFSDKLIGQLRIGYIDSKNDTTGGNTNFRGPLLYVSLDHAL